MDWQDRVTVKKGNVGESVVKDYLRKHGYIPYSPDAQGAHPFDHLCASRDKRKIFIADTKSKPARVYYPDTGININHYQEYKHIQEKYNLDVFLFFVDEDAGTIYGNLLRKLDITREVNHKGKNIIYPLEHKGIRYFPLIAMKDIGKIPEIELSELRRLSTRNELYQHEMQGNNNPTSWTVNHER